MQALIVRGILCFIARTQSCGSNVYRALHDLAYISQGVAYTGGKAYSFTVLRELRLQLNIHAVTRDTPCGT